MRKRIKGIIFSVSNLILTWLILACSLESLAKEVAILTNDNELLIIEHLKANLKQQQHIRAASLQMNTNGTSIIVSKLKDDQNQSSDITQKPSSRQQQSSKLVYISIDNQNPCIRHTCKSSQICLPRPLNQTSINYECVAKQNKKSTSQVKTKSKATATTTTTTTTKKQRPKKILLSKGCGSLSDYIEAETIFRETLLLSKQNSSSFRLIDTNNDSLLSQNEMLASLFAASTREKLKPNRVCLTDLFANLDVIENRLLAVGEIEAFLSKSRPKCSLVRSSLTYKDFYMKKLNEELHISLTSETYVPICDEEGYFAASQCDKNVTCWCVARALGSPVAGTARKINQTPVDCKSAI
jgi:hypothetical protein